MRALFKMLEFVSVILAVISVICDWWPMAAVFVGYAIYMKLNADEE